jgi:hypothetical protein
VKGVPFGTPIAVPEPQPPRNNIPENLIIPSNDNNDSFASDNDISFLTDSAKPKVENLLP